MVLIPSVGDNVDYEIITSSTNEHLCKTLAAATAEMVDFGFRWRCNGCFLQIRVDLLKATRDRPNLF
jgi:hypothetical protein